MMEKRDERVRILKRMFMLLDKNSLGSITEVEALPMLEHMHADHEQARLAWAELLSKAERSEVEEKEFVDYYFEHHLQGKTRIECLVFLSAELKRYQEAEVRFFQDKVHAEAEMQREQEKNEIDAVEPLRPH